jgi:agmatine deiminase
MNRDKKIEKLRKVIMRKILISLVFMISLVNLWSQPLPPVRMCAEWEPARGTLIRWPLGIPYSLVRELAADDSLYVLTENSQEAIQAYDNFIQQNVNLAHCRFIMADTYSHWTRDWGPVSIFNGNDEWGIVDPLFNGYPWVTGGTRWWDEDDAVNSVLGEYFDCEVYQLPAYFTGGNIMTDGHGTGISTIQMVNENLPLMDQTAFLELIETYTGINNYIFTNNIENYGIQHIDCGAKLLDEETILVKQLPVWHPEYNRLEQLAEFLAAQTSCYGRPYNVHRIYCGAYNDNETAAYTNSLILNKKVLVPLFGIDSDAAALQTFQNLMPGYEVQGFHFDNWYYFDALHCRTRAIFDRYMLLIWHKQLLTASEDAESYEIKTMIKDYSQAGLIPDSLQARWRLTGDTDWQSILLQATAHPDSFMVSLPGQGPGAVVEYYLTAADSSGRRESLPRTAPEGFYILRVENSSFIETVLISQEGFLIDNHPNPFNPSTVFRFYLAGEADVKLDIFNIRGEKVKNLLHEEFYPGWHDFTWKADMFPSGIYLYRMMAGNQVRTGKAILLK